MGKQSRIAVPLFLLVSAVAFADSPADPQALRNLVLKIRTQGSFRVPVPGTADPAIHYQFSWGAPKTPAPWVADFPVSPDSGLFFRSFWDKIFLADGSSLDFGGEKLPLTCVHVEGQDNRGSLPGSDPLMPEFLLKVYLVVNDFSCVGPVNPGWPHNSSRRETWDTYLYFEVRDPTVMMPTEARIRYRWNEFAAVLDNP